MSTSPIYKGNTPLMAFTFQTDNGTVVTGLPSSSGGYVVYVHDSAGVRTGAGTIGNINTAAGTCTYQSAAADTANAGIATWWVAVAIGTEPNPRVFDPQHISVFDPTTL